MLDVEFLEHCALHHTEVGNHLAAAVGIFECGREGFVVVLLHHQGVVGESGAAQDVLYYTFEVVNGFLGVGSGPGAFGLVSGNP